ncbi:MAG TPA: heme exporter protein CcmB, partial [Pseudomonadales bacterium]|nr:heme exporter protein CcmB [Pseudomonadales bacterium]
FRYRSEWVNTLFFFIMVTSLFPLGVSPEPKLLQQIAPGIVWIAALLATLLSVDSLFRHDYDDGCLETLLLSPQPLFILVLAKIAAHWCVTGLPLTLIAPLLGGMLYLDQQSMSVMLSSLLLGTPVLSLISAIGAALTVGLKKGGILVALIALPLYIPVLIFGASAVLAASESLPYTGQLLYLGAMLLLAITLAPFAIAGSLRVSLGN